MEHAEPEALPPGLGAVQPAVPCRQVPRRVSGHDGESEAGKGSRARPAGWRRPGDGGKYLLLQAPVMSLYLSARQECGQRGGSMWARQPDTFAIVLSTSAGRASAETVSVVSALQGSASAGRSWSPPVPWALAPANASLLYPLPRPQLPHSPGRRLSKSDFLTIFRVSRPESSERCHLSPGAVVFSHVTLRAWGVPGTYPAPQTLPRPRCPTAVCPPAKPSFRSLVHGLDQGPLKESLCFLVLGVVFFFFFPIPLLFIQQIDFELVLQIQFE